MTHQNRAWPVPMRRWRFLPKLGPLRLGARAFLFVIVQPHGCHSLFRKLVWILGIFVCAPQHCTFALLSL